MHDFHCHRRAVVLADGCQVQLTFDEEDNRVASTVGHSMRCARHRLWGLHGQWLDFCALEGVESLAFIEVK